MMTPPPDKVWPVNMPIEQRDHRASQVGTPTAGISNGAAACELKVSFLYQKRVSDVAC